MGKIIGIVIFSFAMGRALFLGEAFCGGIALMAVLLRVDSIYIYLTPVLWLAMASHGQYSIVWGDFWAIVMVALIITFVGRKNIRSWHQIAIAVCAFAGCNLGYLILTGKAYMFDWLQMAEEIGVLVAIIYILDNIADGYFRGEKSTRISSVASAMLITVASIGIDKVTLIGAISLLVIVIIGGRMEEIAESAMLLGILSFCLSNGGIQPDVIIYMILGAVFAGIIVTRWGYLFSKGAGRMFVICQMVDDTMKKLRQRLAIEEYIPSPASTEKIVASLEEGRESYRLLGKLYRDIGDDREIFSFQLQGMERILDETIKRIRGCEIGQARQEKNGRLRKMAFGCQNYGSLGKSGDTYLYKTFKGENSLMLLSDGMGKGDAAAKESVTVAKTIEKIIECGIDGELALRTVNTTLLGHNGDNFATVDMALIDHQKSKCHLYKMGASITFLKRGSKVYAISKSSLPAGLDRNAPIDKITFRVKEGDVILMISDGIVDCDHHDEEGNWIKERLEAINSKDPDTICQLIMNKCIEKYGIKERDDLTVLCGYVI